MSLINTNGLVLIGPGSEWLWSVISDVVLVVTLAGVYFQLRGNRATRVFEQMTALRVEWSSRTERHARMTALIDLEDRPEADGLPDSAWAVGNWFERLGYLVRQGHVGMAQLSALFGDEALFWWTICDPFVRQTRVRWGRSDILKEFELLAGEVRRAYKRETGAEWVMWDTIGDRIDVYAHLIQMSLDAERGVMPQRRDAGPSPSAA